jgi:LacI family transcriptional regulator
MSIEDDNAARRTTIVEVAERAGVAIGTVSRYLNDQPVRASNRAQIEEAIVALGYRRNALAAAMKTDLTNTVGFLLPSMSEFHSPLLEHLSRLMRQQGRALLTYCHSTDHASVLEGIDFFEAHRVDCLIMDGQSSIDQRVRELVSRGLPVIFYDNDAQGLPIDRVLVDNRAASYRAVRHLIDIGHTRIAVLTGDTQVYTGRERFEGYRQAMAGVGLEIDPHYVLDVHWSEDEAYSGMLKLLALPKPPTAIFCCNYNMTIGVLRMLKDHALRVPDDLSLVSFDDVPLFRLHEAGITAVSQPIHKIAEAINGIINARLSERNVAHAPHRIIIECDIILRGSTRRMFTPENLTRPQTP